METEYTLPDGDKFYLDEPILDAGRQLFAESRADIVKNNFCLKLEKIAQS